ncbi:hypothetical protein LCGC14_0804840 [marine sediment metagenome]|uniref:Uncharacterized protein n=1 Tax=marine sediment metagenome TaxID=412755 RepID=A0A0F9S8N6_9ZZZZ
MTNLKLEFENLTHKFAPLPNSLRSKVFKFLYQHPNATIKTLYTEFGAITTIQKQIVRNYKYQFLKFPPREHYKDIQQNAIPLEPSEHQANKDRELRDRINIIKSFY